MRNRSGSARSKTARDRFVARGCCEGFSLGNYLLLVDYTGRLFREGKTAISAELSGILDRLGTTAEAGKPASRNSRPAACSADSSPPVDSACEKSPHACGVHHLANLADARRDKAN